MRKEDWDKLCRNIYEGKCILLIGPEFPLQEKKTGSATSFSKILSEYLKEEIRQFDLIPAYVSEQLDNREVAQLAGDYINYKSTDKKANREDLETFVADFLNDRDNDLSSDVFTNLSTLPFTFIVNSNYTNFFASSLKQLDKAPQTAYYNFKGRRIELVEALGADELGSQLSPFIYNLFGSSNDPSSLVLSENDLVQFVINIISKNPGLPANVKSVLTEKEKVFLFLGYGFLNRSWYFRILLQALESNNKERMSYALECINNVQIDQDPTVLFFRTELKLSLYYLDQKEFVNDLVKNWTEYLKKKQALGGEALMPDNAPRVFISYKSEDFVVVNALVQRLKQNGIDAWIDRERLQGKWAPAIEQQIVSCDAFVLMQSKKVKEAGETYVNAEVKLALDRARYFGNESDFIFPCYIDDSKSILTDYPKLLEINSYDLSSEEKLDQLVKDIKRSYERNKRKRAA